MLRLVEGMTGPEIAERTGLTPDSVRVNSVPRNEDAPRTAGGEMNEDYLWDRSGPPDPEIEAAGAQRSLPLRYRHRGPEAGAAPRRTRWPRAAAAIGIAAAAALLIATKPSAQNTAWQVAGVRVPPGPGAPNRRQPRTLQAEQVGRVESRPHSNCAPPSGKRITTSEAVRLHAFIWAPPREFVVDTPSARAVDLGCEYTLNVNAAGDGLLHVEMGWVAFQYEDRESFIPAGAECVTRKRRGRAFPISRTLPTNYAAASNA